MVMFIRLLLVTPFLIVINITDFKEFKIKNNATIPLALAGIILSVVKGNPIDSLLGLVLPFVLFPFFVLKMLGAGDIKALCAIGAVMGIRMSLLNVIFTFLSGGIIAIVFMLVSKNFVSRLKYLFNYIRNCILTRSISTYDFGGDSKGYFRFAYAISAGSFLTFANEYMHFVTF